MMFAKKVKIFISVLLTISIKANPSGTMKKWRQILHSVDGKSSQVINREFFSSYGSVDEELRFFRHLINKNDHSSIELACAFPARYTVLRSYYSDVPSINLQKCAFLKSFMDMIKGNYLSLVITSEYFRSPSSAFGHIMLVIHKNKKAGLLDKAVHYAAIAEEDNFLKYNVKGLTGYYPGHYIVDSFFNKLHEYSHKEQRYLFVYRLDVKQENLKLLKYHLFELNKAKFNYYFLNQNCAYRIDALLGLVFDKNLSDNILYTLPREILVKYQNLVLEKREIPPYSTLAKRLVGQLSRSDKDTLNKIILDKRKLKETDSDKIKEFYFFYSQYRFKRDGWFNSRYSSNLKKTKLKFNHFQGETKDISLKTRPHKISLGGVYYKNRTWGYLSFRPVLVDIYTFQKESSHESEFSILNGSFYFNKNSSKLNRLEIVSLKLMFPRSTFFNDQSWQFSFRFDRENPEKKLSHRLFIGIGYTTNIFGYLSYFLNGGFERGYSSDPYVSSELNFFNYFGSKFKFGTGLEHRIFNARDTLLTQVFFNYKIEVNSDLLLRFSRVGKTSPELTFSYRYFF